ncbi:ThiF family adenylyltransferase [Streptomyces antnestii]|uniref:ThiF family adenylyltransferase n=1 Tax=Streptomyces antnestii TaxID=2494256 RepID=A0A3S2YPE3_9ACTN|nr:ThiF family adenylyltransferase [Streptomyces sp. San01]RVU16258.1 ThiF family adenylyltransferase [Streptomyces sp. San01]
MTSDDFHEYVAYFRQHFEEGLIRAGFSEGEAGWEGSIPHTAGTTRVVIDLPTRFPFRPPTVTPVDHDAVPWSWHRDPDGALCLVAEDDHDGLWWTEAPAFLEHVTAWFERADTGWTDDRPDLDLDRYFQPSTDRRLYLYDDLAQYLNRPVRFSPSSNKTMRIKHGTRPSKALKHSKDRFGYVADLGEVDVPPRTWADISTRIDSKADLGRRIRQQTVAIVVLTYRRGPHGGAIVLDVAPKKDGGTVVTRLRSAADTEAARSARAGVLAPELRGSKVALVGAGALGSFIADMLVRSGVRHLTLIDDDVVVPGNLVRHLVGPDAVGLPKVEAVKQHLVRNNEALADGIGTINRALTTGSDAVDHLRNHDLVVNATADFATTALLHVSAQSLGTQVLSAVLQNDGRTYRIDVLPPLNDAAPLPPSTTRADTTAPPLFEAGCGSPISPTPPHAVVEAAAATVRHAVGLLVNRSLHPAGETRHLHSSAERNQQ